MMIEKAPIISPRMLLQAILLLTLLILCSPAAAAAGDFEIDANVLVRYHGDGGVVTVPEQIEKINASAFRDNEDITSVILPEKCFAIENAAFENCSNLRTISLPSTMDTIDTHAFHNCTSLEYIILPEGITMLGDGAFKECTSLGAITIPSSVNEIGPGCFSRCTHLSILEVARGNRNYVSTDNVLFTSDLKTLVQYPAGKLNNDYQIPYGVEIISDSAFAKARHLKKVIIPDTLIEIRDYAFTGCIGFTRIDLPENIKKLGSCSFQHCSNLCRLYVHGNEIEPEINSFDGDTSLIIYAPYDSSIRTYAKRYCIRYRKTDDDTYDYAETEFVF